MKDKDEMMSCFEEKENIIETSQDTSKKMRGKKVFFAQTRKELQALKRIKEEVKAEQKALKSNSNLGEVLPKEINEASDKKKNTEHDKTFKVESGAEEKTQARLVKVSKRHFNRKVRGTNMTLKDIAKKEVEQSKRITLPKERGFWERLGNIIYLNEHEYDIYKKDIEDYKKGKISEEDIKLEWEEIQEYEDAKSDVKLRAAWGAFKLALVGLGLAATVNFGGQLVKSAYNYGYDFAGDFWDDTKKNLEENRERYELLYGDYFPNGEKKQKITLEEYEQLTDEQKSHIMYVPSINAELIEQEDGSMTVVLPEDSGRKTTDVRKNNDTKELER